MFAWGNPSRGDDAVGPWFAERFRAFPGEGFSLVEDFQLQVEHLLDCEQARLLLFVDACEGPGSEFLFSPVVPSAAVAHTSHALEPAELLGHFRRLFSREPPAAFRLTVPGKHFELGSAMSGATRACCLRGARFVEALLRNPEEGHWLQLSGVEVDSCRI